MSEPAEEWVCNYDYKGECWYVTTKGGESLFVAVTDNDIQRRVEIAAKAPEMLALLRELGPFVTNGPPAWMGDRVAALLAELEEHE